MTSAAAQTKEDENYLKAVREQYENYPYPHADPEDERRFFRMPYTESLERLNHHCYSGRKNFHKEFHALVAGGGTGDAVIALAEQLRGTGNEVTYIDMSEASMKVAQARAEVRGLTNIRWIRDSLLNIPELDLGKFDYINSSGVLHHLANPDLGLKTLTDALKDDGAMGIMVYAKYGRMAIYMMQEILRMINRNEPNLQKQIDNAKVILGNLPLTNWLFNSSEMILNEIRSGQDVGIYDMLLHTQDRAYSIPELYEYVEKAGLNFLQFFSDHQSIGHQIYNPAFYIRDERLVKIVGSKSLKQQRALAELLHGKIEKHTFYAAKHYPEPPSADDLDMIPVVSFNIAADYSEITQKLDSKERVIELYHQSTHTKVLLPNGPQLAAIFAQADGRKTLREIYQTVIDSSKDNATTTQTLATQFKPFYEAMHRAGWLYLRHPSSSPMITHGQIQAHIKSKGNA